MSAEHDSASTSPVPQTDPQQLAGMTPETAPLATVYTPPAPADTATLAPSTTAAESDFAPAQVEPAVVSVTVSEDAATAEQPGHHGWTIMLICLGIAIIACCLLIPQMDENRRLFFECEKLKVDLAHLQQQVDLNGQFISMVGKDPTLAERLAQRQMKFIRKGSRVLELEGGASSHDVTPFSLVNLAPPPPMPEWRPLTGRLTNACRDPRARLYLIATGLMCMAFGLVLGANDGRETAHLPSPQVA